MKQAFRSLLVRPGWTMVVLFTLGLGIGANGAILSLTNAIFFRTLPYEEAHRLVALEAVRDGEKSPFSYLNYLDLRSALLQGSDQPALAQLAAYARNPLNVALDGEGLHLDVELVSAEYFALLGHQPRLGRVFTAAEDAPPRGRSVAILSDGLWRRQFADQEFTAGMMIHVNDEPFEVIGVMGPDFRGLHEQAELWLPVTSAATLMGPPFLESRIGGWLEVVGRLADESGFAAANAAASVVMQRLEEAFPDANRDQRLHLKTLREGLFGELIVKMQALAASSLLVLLLACANVSCLLWARTVERGRELALRGALGATRLQLARRLLAESVFLAMLGSLLALVLVRWTLDWLLAVSPLELRQFVAADTGPTVILGVLALGLGTSLVFGLLPALFGARLDLHGELSEGGGGGGGRRPGRLDFLVVAEVALAFVLLCAALFAAERFQRLSSRDLGYRTDRLVTMRIDLWGQHYVPRLARVGVASRLLAELVGTPDVASVALVGPYLPGDETWQTRRMTVENWSGDPLEATSHFQAHYVSSLYFDMMEIRLLKGRSFRASDFNQSDLVVVVSAAAAKKCWPDQNPLGRRLKLGAAEGPGQMVTVVGMVDDLAESGFADIAGPPHLYFFITQIPPSVPPTINVLLRASRDPDDVLLGQLRETVQEVVPDVPAYDVQTLDARLETQLANDRFLVQLMRLFTGLALILAAAGIYGLASYRLASREREYGVRLALGSLPGGLFRRAIGQALGLALRGCLLGGILTLIAFRVFRNRVEDAAFQPVQWIVVAVLLIGLNLAVTAWPAWRASRLDPMTILRQD